MVRPADATRVYARLGSCQTTPLIYSEPLQAARTCPPYTSADSQGCCSLNVTARDTEDYRFLYLVHTIARYYNAFNANLPPRFLQWLARLPESIFAGMRGDDVSISMTSEKFDLVRQFIRMLQPAYLYAPFQMVVHVPEGNHTFRFVDNFGKRTLYLGDNSTYILSATTMDVSNAVSELETNVALTQARGAQILMKGVTPTIRAELDGAQWFVDIVHSLIRISGFVTKSSIHVNNDTQHVDVPASHRRLFPSAQESHIWIASVAGVLQSDSNMVDVRRRGTTLTADIRGTAWHLGVTISPVTLAIRVSDRAWWPADIRWRAPNGRYLL